MDIISGRIDNYHFPSISDKNIKKDDGKLKKSVLKRLMILKFLLYSSADLILKEKGNINDIINNVYKYYLYNKEILNNFDDLEKQLILLQIQKYKNVSDKIKYLYHKTNDTDFLVFDIDRVGK